MHLPFLLLDDALKFFSLIIKDTEVINLFLYFDWTTQNCVIIVSMAGQTTGKGILCSDWVLLGDTRAVLQWTLILYAHCLAALNPGIYKLGEIKLAIPFKR